MAGADCHERVLFSYLPIITLFVCNNSMFYAELASLKRINSPFPFTLPLFILCHCYKGFWIVSPGGHKFIPSKTQLKRKWKCCYTVSSVTYFVWGNVTSYDLCCKNLAFFVKYTAWSFWKKKLDLTRNCQAQEQQLPENRVAAVEWLRCALEETIQLYIV